MRSSPPRRSLDLLLVEDNAADVRLAREVLGDGPAAPVLHVVRDGEEAMRFLRKEPPHGDAPRPAVIVLDLNLPRRDGRDVLAEIKGDRGLCTIPVIVFTTSRYAGDVEAAYRLGANAYVAKPLRLDAFGAALGGITAYWLGVVSLPTMVTSGDRGAAAEPGA